MKELEVAIKPTKSTAPGPEQIHYEMLSKLPYKEKVNLLNFMNYIWTNDIFPSC